MSRHDEGTDRPPDYERRQQPRIRIVYRDSPNGHGYKWIAGIAGSIIIAELLWVGNALIGHGERLAKLETSVNTLIGAETRREH